IARLPDSKLTRAGAVLGTAAYSSPEALSLSEFSPASDQFSFAAMLYETISGRRPFEGDDALAIASKIALDEPPLLRRAADGSPLARAGAVLGRGMAKDPKSRYPSCTELADTLV